MTDLGLTVVRLGPQMWSSIEPGPGNFTWEWLDEVVSLLAAAGQEIVIATPTAAPPRWLARQKPEVLLVGPDGRQRPLGGQHQVCLTSAAYRGEARRITTELVRRYGHHPAVTGWQLHDAIDAGNVRCWCPSCQHAFRQWLQTRYESIDRLNSAWGTMVRSGTYGSFDEVDLPRAVSGGQSPSLLLAHRRFASHQAHSFLAQLADVVRQLSPGRLRIVSVDLNHDEIAVSDSAVGTTLGHRVAPHDVQDPYEVALRHGLVRGGASDAGAWVTELAVGRWEWRRGTIPMAPGALTRWCQQALHHGIHTVLLSRWRAGRYGQEQHHDGLLHHDGSPARPMAEIRGFLEELQRSTAAAVERPRARVAMLYDPADAWALEAGLPVEVTTHREFLRAAHEAASRLGVDVDVLPVDHDLERYELVLLPALHLARPETITMVERLLNRGVTVVMGPRSFVRTEDATWVEVPEPAGLAPRLGARTTASVAGEETRLQPWNCAAGAWTDAYALLEHSDAEVLARYDSGILAGRPAAVRRGNFVALGASSGEAWTQLLAELLRRVPAPAGVERFERLGAIVELDHRS
ncbi:MAG: Beta-galactosidase, partial [Acidimicrobiia bacterium]|nr:Beta-galactosidase [Acidimicrobiia bacterium]